MSYDRNAVLNVARGELGYHEKASNASLDDKTANAGSGNFTKYARDLDALGYFYNGPKQGFAYCDVGVDWCFVKAYGVEAALELLCQPKYSAGAGCYYSAMYFKQRGQFFGQNTVPQPGDQIFFTYAAGEVSHTGIVEDVVGDMIRVIEFNTSDQVARRAYQVGSAEIYGYGRPNYGTGVAVQQTSVSTESDDDITALAMQTCTAEDEANTCQISFRVLSSGVAGTSVERLQTLLIARGYKCGGKTDPRTGVEIPDGDFGPTTKKAVEDFQTANGLVADGIVGADTMTALLK